MASNCDACVSFVGNLISEPKTAQANNSSRLNFGVGVRTSRKPEGAQYYENDIYNVTVWGKDVEYLANSLQKGTSVWVEGALQLNKWKTRDGVERTDLTVSANKVKVLSKAKGSKSQSKNEDEDETVPF